MPINTGTGVRVPITVLPSGAIDCPASITVNSGDTITWTLAPAAGDFFYIHFHEVPVLGPANAPWPFAEGDARTFTSPAGTSWTTTATVPPKHESARRRYFKYTLVVVRRGERFVLDPGVGIDPM